MFSFRFSPPPSPKHRSTPWPRSTYRPEFDLLEARETPCGVMILQSLGTTDLVEGSITDTYTAVLTSMPTAPVLVTFSPDAQVTTLPAVLTFSPANWNVAQIATVTAVDDAAVEGNHTGVVTHTTSSADTNYNSIVVASVTANLRDNENAGVTILDSGGNTTIVEGGANDTYLVVLNTVPTANVDVTLSPDAQFTVSLATLSFTPINWNIAQTVTVTAINDVAAEGSHTGITTIVVASGDPIYNATAVPSLTANIIDSDTAGVTPRSTGGTTDVAEAIAPTPDSYSVVLNFAPTADVTINFNSGTELTVAPASLVFTAANWSTLQNVTVTAINDGNSSEGPHIGIITHSATSADFAYNGIAIPSITANITDNSCAASVTVTESGGTTDVAEAGANDTFTMVLTSAPTANVTININAGSQLLATPTFLVFTPVNWNISQTATIVALDDALVEGPHSDTVSFTVSSSDTNYNGLAITSVNVNITDNDVVAAGVTVTQSSGTTDVAEGGATDIYYVVLNSAPTGNVTININAGSQLTAASATFVFTPANWNTPQSDTITAVDDALVEGPHSDTVSFTVSSSDASYNGLAIASVNVNITDNDVVAAGVTVTQTGGTTNVAEGGATDIFYVVLDSAPTGNVTININAGSQLTVSPTTFVFTPANWNTPQSDTITAVDDALVEGPHSGTVAFTVSSSDASYNGLAIANVNVSITDNDVVAAGVTITQSGGSTNVTEGGATDIYYLVLNSAPTGNVTIALNAGTQVTASPSSILFTTANWNTPRSVTVTAVNDVLVEGGHSGTVIHTVSSVDANYNGLAVASVNVSITDNDVATSVTLTQSGGATDVTEGGATDSVTLVLASAPTATVTISINAGTQLSVPPATLTFTTTNWSTPRTVVVTAVNDVVVEGPHPGYLTFTVASSDARYNGLPIPAVFVNITDNDVAGITLTETGGSTDVAEAAATDTFYLVLSSAPIGNVYVVVVPDSQQVVSPATVVFTAVNWNTPQVVKVTAVDDFLIEGAHTGTINHTVASTDPNYNGLPGPSLIANIADNDIPGVMLTDTAAPLGILEGGTKTYAAVLGAPPTANVTVTLAPDPQLNVSATLLFFTSANWNVPQPVIVTAVDNALLDGNRAALITHTCVSADPIYNAIAVANIATNILDNDGTVVSGTSLADKIYVVPSADLSKILVTVGTKATSVPATVAMLILDVGDGNDLIQIANPIVPILIRGRAGADKVTLIGRAGANAFTLDQTSVTINGIPVRFESIEGLTLGGKSGDDIFTITAFPDCPVQLNGDLGNDHVLASTRANTWVITAKDSGVLNTTLKFAAVENLTGGTNADGFFFGDNKGITGAIDGGTGGGNIFDYSLCNAAVAINLQTATATAAKSFSNVDQFIGGKNLSDKLISLDAVNLWDVSNNNAGTVGAVSFQKFENLTGGALDDTFRLADNKGLKGKIDGGGGTNVLDYGGYLSTAITINLQSRLATNLAGFVNLQSFIGGAAGDTLVGANQANIWAISTSNTGTVNALVFTAFENLTGGLKTDNFTVSAGADWTGLLSGGSGTDTLTSYAGSAYTSTGTGAGLLNGRRFQNIEVRL